MSFALATPMTDFQRQHRRNVETGRRGGTEGGEVTAEECYIAPRCRVEESAGINRHGGGDGRALRRRASGQRRPRVMRRRPARAWRSVDRGTCRPGYRAAKSEFRGAHAVQEVEGNTAGG